MKKINFDSKKTDSYLEYRFIETQTLNKLKKLINLISFTSLENNLSYCYQDYINDEIRLNTI